MTATGFHDALDPKCIGSWNLHELLPTDMDFFILLSSFCGIMGNRGQSNYAAGNTFQDALARYRVSKGLKAMSVDLALVGEAGWAYENYERAQKSLRIGHGGIKQAELMSLLDALCDPSHDCQHPPGGAQVVNIIDSPGSLYRLAQDGVLAWMNKPLFNNILRIGEAMLMNSDGMKQGEEADIDYVALVRAAANIEEAGEAVLQGLVQKLGKSLLVSPESLDVAKPAHVLGVDSLIAVELRYWFAKQLGVEVAVFNILKDQSLTALCEEVAGQVPTKC